MASRRSFLSKVSSMFASSSTDLEPKSKECELELDEAEVWNNWNDENKSSVGESKKKARCGGRVKPVASSSIPLTIPHSSNNNRGLATDEHYDYDGKEPPHEYLARTREPSHSVQEGRGRTLKGSAFRTFRNSLWKVFGIPD